MFLAPTHDFDSFAQIAKMLQNLANSTSYQKEPYMSSLMSLFVDHNRVAINKFFNDLCEVGDFYETLEVSDYKYVSNIILTIIRWINIWHCPSEIYKST